MAKLGTRASPNASTIKCKTIQIQRKDYILNRMYFKGYFRDSRNIKI